MPLNTDIEKVLVIGSGPIVIGQAAEFDYAGTQACRTLKEAGVKTVLINSNPATIMTDEEMADKVFLEPLQIDVIKRIIIEERVNAVLASVGGQTGLNIATELSESGFLAEHQVKVIGTAIEGIQKGEDRELFRDVMEKISIPCIPSGIAHDHESAKALAEAIGYPVIVRPAFTLGGTGGGIALDEEELIQYVESGLAASRVHQILVEKSIYGWKEIEFEAVRDAAGQVVIVCSMENFDPVGIHTGDSIVFAPAQTLSAAELEMLREAVIRIVDELAIEGGCNVQFALEPVSGEYAIIEVNPRLSRSSALASKATAYPIAKIATWIALGYRLDEIETAPFADKEPDVRYIVCKIPKWPFDKFVFANRKLGTQMKATGEVMSIGHNLKASLMKAIRSLEQKQDGLLADHLISETTDQILSRLDTVDDSRLFVVAEALRRGIPRDVVYEKTKIDLFFLSVIEELALLEQALIESRGFPEDELLADAFHCGLADSRISLLSGTERETIYQRRQHQGFGVGFHLVDTFDTISTAYYYSVPGLAMPETAAADKEENKRVVVLGSGPIRIGQGIEFDYCSVHAIQELRKQGYEAIIINNNPETVSTDYDISDRLYFEPLTEDDVRAVLEAEKPLGVICQFGGQTAIKLISAISDLGYRILGSSVDSVDMAEDRKRFDQILADCDIARPEGSTVYTTAEALLVAEKLAYPVLLRPSYVLGGQGMQICYHPADIREYMALINRYTQEHPILVDKYLMGTELEVDAVTDGREVLIPGIMEHLERAGIHSGDSHSIFPAYIPDKHRDTIVEATRKLARRMRIVGLINIQFILYNDEIYVIEVNPRSSRTVPYISKVTGLPVVRLATDVMLGKAVEELGYGSGLYARYPRVYAVKAPVFSFEKLHNVEPQLGPEMKSTGEVLGLAPTYAEAMYKAVLASSFRFPDKASTILLTVKDADKDELLPLAERLEKLGYRFVATGGTAHYLNMHGVPTSVVRKLGEDSPNIMDLLKSGNVKLLLSTDSVHDEENNGFRLRRHAIEHGIPTITSMDTFLAMVECFEQGLKPDDINPIDVKSFSKMVEAGRMNLLPA